MQMLFCHKNVFKSSEQLCEVSGSKVIKSRIVHLFNWRPIKMPDIQYSILVRIVLHKYQVQVEATGVWNFRMTRQFCSGSLLVIKAAVGNWVHIVL